MLVDPDALRIQFQDLFGAESELAKIYAALGIDRDLVKTLEPREEPALQAVGNGAAAA